MRLQRDQSGTSVSTVRSDGGTERLELLHNQRLFVLEILCSYSHLTEPGNSEARKKLERD